MKSVLTPKTHVLTKKTREAFQAKAEQAKREMKNAPHTLEGQLVALKKLSFATSMAAANIKK